MLKYREVIISFLLVAMALPAAAQLRSGRTMMDAPKSERPKTTAAATTPDPQPPQPPPPLPTTDQRPTPQPGTTQGTTQPTTPRTESTELMALDEQTGQRGDDEECDE